MKKWIVRIALVVVVLLVIVVVAVGLFLDSGIKKGVETFGPELTKVSIKLDSVSVSLLSGGGKIKGLVVGNPEGCKSPSAITLSSASLSLKPGSLLSDKIVIKSIVVEAPEITIEGSPTKNNLTKIMENVDAAVGGSGAPVTNAPAATVQKASKKLQVDEFVITGAKVHYTIPGMGGKVVTLPMPDIRLNDLGTGPDGITAADLTKRVLNKLTGDVVKVLVAEGGKLGKEAVGTVTDAAGKAAGEAGKTIKGVTDIFKKK